MYDSNIRDFAELITDLRGGQVHQELSNAFVEATEAAKRTGKVASVTLQIKIKPAGDRQCEVTDSITKKIPVPTKLPTVMFVDDFNNLTRNDRRQMRIDDVVTIEHKTPETFTVNAETGELIEVK